MSGRAVEAARAPAYMVFMDTLRTARQAQLNLFALRCDLEAGFASAVWTLGSRAINTRQVQSDIRTDGLSAGFVAAMTNETVSEDLEHASERYRDAETGRVDWMRYCVRNQLI